MGVILKNLRQKCVGNGKRKERVVFKENAVK